MPITVPELILLLKKWLHPCPGTSHPSSSARYGFLSKNTPVFGILLIHVLGLQHINLGMRSVFSGESPLIHSTLAALITYTTTLLTDMGINCTTGDWSGKSK